MASKTIPTVVVEWSPTKVAWVDNGYHVADSLQEAAAHLAGNYVVVAVSRRTAFLRAYRVPNTSKAEVARILDVQIGQLVPIQASDISYDFHLTDDLDSEGRLAIVVAMRSSDLLLLHEQAKAAGLHITRVVPSAIGAAFLARKLGQPDAAVVHRTAEGLAIDLVRGGELRYSRIAPLPNSSLGIEAEISRTFAAAVLPCSPTIAAGGLALAEAESATDHWGLENLLDPAIDINIQTPAQKLAIGIAESRRRIRLSLLIFLASLLVFTFAYFRWSDAKAQVDKSTAAWTRILSKSRRIRDENSRTNAELTDLNRKLSRGFAPAQGLGDIIFVVSNSTPSGLWLTGVSVEKGKAITIRGTAKDSHLISQYQTALVADPRLRDVQLVFANNSKIQDTPVVQFSMSAFPVGNLPLVDPNDTKKAASKVVKK